MIVLRKHPALQPALNLIVLNKGMRKRPDHEMEERLAQASIAIFGLTLADVDLSIPDWVPDTSPEHWPANVVERFNAHYEAWSKPFDDYRDLDQAERIAFLRSIGWDVLDDRGQILECLDHFILQILHIQAGRGGKSFADIEAEAWIGSMKPSVRSPPSQVEVQKNRQMLALGQYRRRRGAAS